MEKIYEIQWNWQYSNSSKKKEQVPPVLDNLFHIKSFANFTPSRSDKRTLLDRKEDLITWWNGNRLGLIYPLLTAFGLSKGDKNKKQILEEQKIVRLLMKESNFKPEDDIFHSDLFYAESFLQFFVRLNNPHLALAILPSTKLNLSQKEVDEIYRHIGDNLLDKEKIIVFPESKRLNETLVYELFKKDVIPSNKKLFVKMAKIVYRQDNSFFEKKKQQMLNKLKQAKTPFQIYSTLINKQGERK